MIKITDKGHLVTREDLVGGPNEDKQGFVLNGEFKIKGTYVVEVWCGTKCPHCDHEDFDLFDKIGTLPGHCLLQGVVQLSVVCEECKGLFEAFFVIRKGLLKDIEVIETE